VSSAGPDYRVSRWLLVRGLPRDPHAAPHLIAMLVSAVATVLLVRAFLAASGYPQIGGGGLHIAHVLWGGLLMVVGLVLLLSFVGPVIRPLAAVLSGVGIGLFIDEIGKFVTSDNDYFYRPAAAVMYVVVVSLVLLVHVMHGRRPHCPQEHLAAAVDQAVAGVAGGFTPHRRAEVYAQLRRADGAPGVAETRALVRAVPDDPVELFDPIRLADVRRLSRRLRRILYAPRAADVLPTVTAAVLIVQVAYAAASFGPRLLHELTDPGAHRGPPGPVPLTLGLASTLVCAALVGIGMTRLRRDNTSAFRWFNRALLVNLLFTRVFEFDVEQFLAAASVVVDVLLLGVVTAALAQRKIDAEVNAGSPSQRITR
jgi:hypothetical protein